MQGCCWSCWNTGGGSTRCRSERPPRSSQGPSRLPKPSRRSSWYRRWGRPLRGRRRRRGRRGCRRSRGRFCGTLPLRTCGDEQACYFDHVAPCFFQREFAKLPTPYMTRPPCLCHLTILERVASSTLHSIPPHPPPPSITPVPAPPPKPLTPSPRLSCPPLAPPRQTGSPLATLRLLALSQFVYTSPFQMKTVALSPTSPGRAADFFGAGWYQCGAIGNGYSTRAEGRCIKLSNSCEPGARGGHRVGAGGGSPGGQGQLPCPAAVSRACSGSWLNHTTTCRVHRTVHQRPQRRRRRRWWQRWRRRRRRRCTLPRRGWIVSRFSQSSSIGRPDRSPPPAAAGRTAEHGQGRALVAPNGRCG